MKTTHVVPGDSAAGSVRQALLIAERDDQLLTFVDELHWGPIASDDQQARADWWQEQIDWPEIEENVRSFWTKVEAAEGRVVLWFGRHSARELAFRLAWASRMVGRPYYVIDVTGLRIPVQWGNGSDGIIESVQAVSVVPANGLAKLLGSEKPASLDEDISFRNRWMTLKAENAPFRVVTATGLESAPLDYFDMLLLQQAGPEWTKVAFIVGGALNASREPYLQVGDLRLQNRVVELINQGKLVAEGDVWDMWGCHIRLPQ